MILSKSFIVSLYIYNFSFVIDFSSEKYIGSTRQIVLVSEEKMQWGCQRGDFNLQPLCYKFSALAIELNSQVYQSRWCIGFVVLLVPWSCRPMGFLVGDLGLGLRSVCLLGSWDILLLGLFDLILVSFWGSQWFCSILPHVSSFWSFLK